MKKIIFWFKSFFLLPMFGVKEVKKVLREQTHGGKYWKAKPRYHRSTGEIHIVGPADHVYLNIYNGLGYYHDLEADGCDILRSCDLILKRETNGALKIYRKI